ncbi:hypothetical protein [Endozoicomonas sp. GU-1]|nr:hypothetical protein [Endozoicomonas sp. GU-1]WBA84481.1 hypothetical protein O3276_14380 [Endozoicomonas sp. GU-1]
MVLPGIVLLAAAFNTAWNLVQSEVWRSQTEVFLNHWETETNEDAGFTVDKEEWQLTLAGADNALENMPGSPDLQMLRAKVLDRGVKNGWSVTDSGEPMELDAWQQAIVLRPGWPYSWSSYALARAQRSLIDQPFELALVRADQLGPWEQQVMENATILGRYYRGWLNEPLQHMLDQSQQRLTKIYPYRAKQIERQYPLP